MSDEHKLIQTEWGSYRIADMPTDQELQEYYRDKYYQEGCGSYEVSYSDEEKAWYQLKADILRMRTEQLLPNVTLSLLDVGCGEGWLMETFQQAGHTVKGVDFSVAGIEKLHPHLVPVFDQGDLYTYLDDLQTSDDRYHVVSCCNVVEHVPDPARLIAGLKRVTTRDGYMVLTVPNDFSPLHQHLLAEGLIEKPWWIRLPDHLSYFNKDSMLKLLGAHDLVVDAIVADNSIDLNLLNDNTNYIKDPAKGKATHEYRVRLDNFLGSINREKLVELYSVYGDMGVGRNLTYFARHA